MNIGITLRANRSGFLLASAALAIGLAGCGGDAEVEPTSAGEAWGQAAEPSSTPVVSGAELRIGGISFEPPQAIPGQPLSVDVETGRGVALAYSWRADGRRMAADGPTIVVPSDLVRGDRLEVEVVATDDARVSEPEVASVVVGNRAPRIEQLTIRIVEGEEGSLGHWVADPEATDPDEDDIEFRYEWRVDGGDVVSGSDRLSRDDWKRGARIELVAWASDGEKEGLPLASAPFEIGNSPPDIVSRPPGIDASGRFVYQVEARDRDGDRGLRYSLVDGPTAMSIDPFSGELTWKATLADAGEHFVEIEVDDRRGGATRQRFFVNVQVDAPPAARAN